MNRVTPPSSRVFDLREASAKLDPLTARRRWVSIGSAVFLAALGVLVFAAKTEGIPYRAFDAYAIFDLSVFGVIVMGGLAILVPDIIRGRPGAVHLTISDRRFALIFSDGRKSTLSWSDPQLRFEIMDCSGVNPAKLRSGMPYTIVVHGVTSVLTNEAYLEMIDRITRNGLIDNPKPGSKWVFSSDATPVIHRVRARVGTR